MGEYNRYINSFVDVAEYDNYIKGSIADVPNTALIDNTGEIKMTKFVPGRCVMFGTTTGTQDFMIGQSSSRTSSPDCIKIHVVVEDESGINKMYATAEDVLKTPKYFYSSYNGFSTTEGKKIVSITKWKIDTSNVTDMSEMFNDCSNLTSLDLSGFDTSKVTNMSSMFYKCLNLTSLDVSNFDTSNVTNMSSMFYYCSILPSLDLSNFDTSNVTDMSEMFNDCSRLTSLDLSNFDTSNLTNMNNMFYGCSGTKKLRLSSDFFNSSSLEFYDLNLRYWTEEISIRVFVNSLTDLDGEGRVIGVSRNTFDELIGDNLEDIRDCDWEIRVTGY